MIDDPVRLGNLPQGLAFMTFPPARRLVRRFAQARHPRRLLEPVTRRRLAAVGTVQSQPSLKLGDRALRAAIGRLRLDQCNQFFPRWLAWRLRNSRILELKQDSAVEEKLQVRPGKIGCPTWAVTGIVLSTNVSLGQLVSTMVPVTLLTMVDDSTRRVRAFVDEGEISTMCLHQRARVTADAVRSIQMTASSKTLALQSTKIHLPEICRGNSGR